MGAPKITTPGHRVRWFVRLDANEWIPRQATMRGLWYYDARWFGDWFFGSGPARVEYPKVPAR